MSLSITIMSHDVIYQCADFRLTDTTTGRPRDFVAQKGIFLNRFSWSAVVSFVGVGQEDIRGRADLLDVAEWLASRTSRIPQDASLEELTGALLEANAWFSALPGRHFHTFTVGAFVGIRSRAILVSSFESLHARPLSTPKKRLENSQRTYWKPGILVTGQPNAVNEDDRRRLLGLVQQGRPHQEVHEALARANERAARANGTISPACFTAHLRITGEGEAIPHGLDESREYLPSFALPQVLGLKLNPALDEHGQPKPLRLQGMSFGRWEQTEAFHREQMKAKPDDPSIYSNYGAFLSDVQKDPVGAARAYLKALSLDPNHANALGNYANYLWHNQGDLDGAEQHYLRAVTADPRNSIHRANYAAFLRDARQDPEGAEALFRAGLALNERDETLLRVFAEFKMLRGEYAHAARLYEGYLDLRPRDPDALTNCATAHRLSGGSRDRCAALYRRALSERPDLPLARANLAQLLFCQDPPDEDTDQEATDLLAPCLELGDTMAIKIEAWFYRLAHVREGRDEAIERLQVLIGAGARSPGWDLSCNVERASRENHPDRELIAALADVIAGRVDAIALNHLAAWRTRG